jgi:hypothetical protein
VFSLLKTCAGAQLSFINGFTLGLHLVLNLCCMRSKSFVCTVSLKKRISSLVCLLAEMLRCWIVLSVLFLKKNISP